MSKNSNPAEAASLNNVQRFGGPDGIQARIAKLETFGFYATDEDPTTVAELLATARELAALVKEAPVFFSPQHDFDGDKLRWLERAGLVPFQGSATEPTDAERWQFAMDWGQKKFAVCRREGMGWTPIKTDGPIDEAMLKAKAKEQP